MAFQIDPNIPLQAMANPINIGDAFAKAQSYQANALKLQALRDKFDEEKAEKLRQKQMRQGMASELQKMQQGTPAQYRTDFVQTMPTGQMPQGMTGVLAAERGQNLPTPDLFGENILKGNFDVNHEVVSPAVAGRTPDLKDYLEIQLKTAIANQDPDLAFDAFKKLKELEKNPAKYFGGLTEAVDATGKPILLAMTEGGAVPSGYSPRIKELTPYEKAQQELNERKFKAEQEKALREYQQKEREINFKANKPDPVTQALAIAQGKEDIKMSSEQRAKVAEKYADASTAIDLLDDYIATAEKAPKTGAGEYLERGLGFFGAGNKEQQTAMGAMAQKAAALVTLAQKQTGPQSDKDVQNYKEQMGAIANAPNMEVKIAAAKAAREFARRIQQKFGSYASDILSGKVTPEELKARQESVNTGNQAPDLSKLPTSNIEKGSVAKDPKTGKPIAMFNGSKWIPWGGK